jgi:hypothetical protein
MQCGMPGASALTHESIRVRCEVGETNRKIIGQWIEKVAYPSIGPRYPWRCEEMYKRPCVSPPKYTPMSLQIVVMRIQATFRDQDVAT